MQTPLRQVSPDPVPEADFRTVRLDVTNFRGYETLRLEPSHRFVVLTGPNGAGKTNLLEALSFLTPGRGLRQAKLSDVLRSDLAEKSARQGAEWAVAGRFAIKGHETAAGIACRTNEMGTGERREYRLDGAKSSAVELRKIFGVQWLTPRMDRLFQEGKAERRRFLDRLVFGSDPEHGRRVADYEASLRERAQLLKRLQSGKQVDATWLDAVEARLAADAVAISAARNTAVRRLNMALTNRIEDQDFPRAKLEIDGEVETALLRETALAVEDDFVAQLAMNRPLDMAAGRNLKGPHRSDLNVTYVEKGLPAAQCSTGEQKALLVAIILAQARLEQAERGMAPLLLMDEACAHLDAHRRTALFRELALLGTQVWFTGTEEDAFAELKGDANYYRISNHTVI